MAQVKARANPERISKARAAKASVLTCLTVAFFLVFCYHCWWALGALYNNEYGSLLKNTIIIVGGLVLNAYVSVQILLFIETRFLSNGIDSDHKKYI